MTDVARLGFGTATFMPAYGFGADAAAIGETDRRRLLLAVLESGLRYVDTSPVYGDAETVLGALAGLLETAGARICVKLTAETWHAGTWARDFAASLTRLQRRSVDSVMIHSALTDDVVDARLGDTMARLKGDGTVRRTGASTYGARDARRALEQPWCDAVQIEYSILNPSVIRDVRAVKGAGQEIVVRSVLCKGLLTGRRHSVHGIVDGLAGTLDELDALAGAWGFTLPELAIRFAIDTPGVDIVLVGLSSLSELATAVAAAARPPLTERQLGRLAEFDRSGETWSHPERWKVPA